MRVRSGPAVYVLPRLDLDALWGLLLLHLFPAAAVAPFDHGIVVGQATSISLRNKRVAAEVSLSPAVRSTKLIYSIGRLQSSLAQASSA
jgi:hypothetical protein